MKAACIVPISALSLIEDHSYYLALAHIALGSSAYASFYRSRSKETFVILDNSVHELGKPLEPFLLAQAMQLTKPDLLVLPDNMWDPEENLALARTFLLSVPELADIFPRLQLMAVPHGRNASEYTCNLEALLDLSPSQYPLTYVGLGKIARRLGLRTILAKQAISAGKKVHFLGAWEDPVAELLEGKELGEAVTGIDTSYVTRLGLLGRTLLEPFPTPPSLDFLADEDTYDMDWLKRQLEAFRWLAEGPASTAGELEQEYKNGRF